MDKQDAAPTDSSTEGSERAVGKKLLVLAAVALFFAIAVYDHWFHVNSHYYHTWIWRRLPGAPTFLMLGAAGIPFFLGQLLAARPGGRTPIALAFVSLSMFCLMLAGAAAQRSPPSLDHISAVQMGWDTGYFSDAKRLQGMSVKQWLTRYPHLLAHFDLHPRTKPPGLLLYETALIDLFGPGPRAALIAGLIVGFVAMFSVTATYMFIRYFTGDRRAAFFGASYLALCPGPVLIFPMFDQCYPIVTLAVTLLWALALEKDRLRYAVALGIVYGAVTVVTYLPITLGFFLLGYAWLKRAQDPDCRLPRILKHAGAALAAFVIFYWFLWAVTGFDPIATFRECVRQVGVLWAWLVRDFAAPPRHLPGTIPADLYDFALGSGWISFVLAAFYFKSALRDQMNSPRTRFALLCAGQIMFVALAGLIQGETARLWIFMLPMLMAPVSLELAKWGTVPRMTVYLMLLLLTALICQSMTFFPSAA